MDGTLVAAPKQRNTDDKKKDIRAGKIAAEIRGQPKPARKYPLKREGVQVNWKKLYRLYNEERLTVRKRDGRKRALV